MTDFTYTGAIEFDHISASGMYDITADGAQGGSGTDGGGLGAAVGGDIYLTSGTVLEIVVGGEGKGGDGGGAGGGGGSFVFETLSGMLTPIVIAGGGGGGGFSGGRGGRAARSGGGGGSGGTGGVGPAGGHGASGLGGGGGGYTGGSGAYYTGGPHFQSQAGAAHGTSFAGGTAGQEGSHVFGAGGFGGGGGGGGQGGGGGGGYGGGGGGGGMGGGGGGGGSYLSSELTGTFATASTVSGDGDITVSFESSLCYLHGTRILTPTGTVAVENLAIGDAVVTRFGGMQRIKWLGRQGYAAGFIGNNPEKWPVCIKAGTLEDGVPARDLYVSPGHSILLGDVLVLASCMVNGVTVVQRRPASDVHYVQIELEGHDCVAAEGAWAETFADAPGLRARFHNAAEFYALYPESAPVEALKLCAKRPERGAMLQAALMPVVARAEVVPGRLEGWLETAEGWRIEGWARDVAHPELPVVLEFCVGGAVIGTALACESRGDLVKAGKGRCAFRFTPPMRLTAGVLAGLEVRRVADAAVLPGSEGWRRVG